MDAPEAPAHGRRTAEHPGAHRAVETAPPVRSGAPARPRPNDPDPPPEPSLAAPPAAAHDRVRDRLQRRPQT
ncbi:hypothetical protein GCM10010503_63960 [Streptomyces lucensis JCM 4490]|uniref:Uncharacterized protein n=1 Tax=Streptomyces lucensis JCM 4490 TaxID=1306176 RepID=A0A918JEP9_9ACTN|nr:hypothetical protein GCM10010503_63960 [Streptomyces lucensis JCM 4490]